MVTSGIWRLTSLRYTGETWGLRWGRYGLCELTPVRALTPLRICSAASGESFTAPSLGFFSKSANWASYLAQDCFEDQMSSHLSSA